MPDGIKNFLVTIPSNVYHKYINKVKFYDLKNPDIFLTLIEKFNNGDFDDLFGIPKEE